MLSITPQLIIAEFDKRGIECKPVDTLSPKIVLEFVDWSGQSRYICGTVSDKGSASSCRIADDKLIAAAIAQNLGISVPKTEIYESSARAQAFLKQYGTIVVKPLDSAHGNGVSVNVDTEEKLQKAVSNAQKYSQTILLQQQVAGRDIRMLYIGGKFCAASERRPASVTGDGKHTIRELIEITNSHPDRGEHYQKKYNIIPLAVSEIFLADRIDDMPTDGEEVRVIGTANVGSGGTAIDVTDDLPAELLDQSERLVAGLKMGICGVDVIQGPDGYYLIEINASPSFGLHHHPHEGKPRDVAQNFVDWLLVQ